MDRQCEPWNLEPIGCISTPALYLNCTSSLVLVPVPVPAGEPWACVRGGMGVGGGLAGDWGGAPHPPWLAAYTWLNKQQRNPTSRFWAPPCVSQIRLAWKAARKLQRYKAATLRILEDISCSSLLLFLSNVVCGLFLSFFSWSVFGGSNLHIQRELLTLWTSGYMIAPPSGHTHTHTDRIPFSPSTSPPSVDNNFITTTTYLFFSILVPSFWCTLDIIFW